MDRESERSSDHFYSRISRVRMSFSLLIIQNSKYGGKIRNQKHKGIFKIQIRHKKFRRKLVVSKNLTRSRTRQNISLQWRHFFSENELSLKKWYALIRPNGRWWNSGVASLGSGHMGDDLTTTWRDDFTTM